MEIDVLHIDRFIEKSGCKEVTSSNIFSQRSTEPEPDGLGSYEIFGRPGTPERRETFGYISLNGRFVHPHAYIVLIALARSIQDMIFGDDTFYIEDGKIKRFTEGMKVPAKTPVGTGIDFLYKNFELIDFNPKNAVGVRKNRLEFINALSKDEIFIDKWLVVPPFYRDVDMVNGKKNELNIMYSRLINSASMIKSSSGMFQLYQVTDAHRNVQRTLVEIYDNFISFNAGVHGFIHEHVMGKSTDYSARLVISTPSLNVEKPDDMEVSFNRSAIPLSKVIKCFAPFVVYGVKQIVDREIAGAKYITVETKKGKWERKELAPHWAEAVSPTEIYRLIEIYDNSKEHRMDTFTVETIDGEKVPLCYLTSDHIVMATAFEPDRMNDLKWHPMNLTELFYMAAHATVRDKTVLVTRYPIEDYHNIYPSQMNIIPCIKTKVAMIDEIVYDRYPDFEGITLDNVDKFFVDTLRVFPTYLKALGGDFDGDMCSLQGVFSDEAIAEEIAYNHSVTNIVNIAGGTMRQTSDVTSHTIFGLTAGPEGL